jgi:hypothetical protein
MYAGVVHEKDRQTLARPDHKLIQTQPSIRARCRLTSPTKAVEKSGCAAQAASMDAAGNMKGGLQSPADTNGDRMICPYCVSKGGEEACFCPEWQTNVLYSIQCFLFATLWRKKPGFPRTPAPPLSQLGQIIRPPYYCVIKSGLPFILPAASMVAVWTTQPDPLLACMGDASRQLAQFEGGLPHALYDIVRMLNWFSLCQACDTGVNEKL